MFGKILNKIKCKIFFCSKCSINVDDEDIFTVDIKKNEK